MPHSCYLVITPDPRTNYTLLTLPNPAVNQTVQCFYIKFGDGPAAADYHRANPNHAFRQNDLAPSKFQSVITYKKRAGATELKEETRQPGKWLEWQHIKITGGSEVYQGTEWHELRPKPGHGPALRQNLCHMLDMFPQWNRWEENGHSDAITTAFENLVDQTWSCNHRESIAYFP